MSEEATSERLADIIFQRSRDNEISNETEFSGFLAALVGITLPGGIQGAFVVLAAVLLFAMSIMRRLTHTGRYSNGERFLAYTIRPVELCAIICVTHLLTYVARHLIPFISLSLIEAVALLAVVTYIAYITFLEVWFETYRLGWGALFYVRWMKANERFGYPTSVEQLTETLFNRISGIREAIGWLILSILKRIWLETAYYVLRGALPETQDKYIRELKEFVENVRKVKRDTVNIGVAGTVIVTAVVVVPVFIATAFSLTTVINFLSALDIGVLSMLLVLVTMRLMKHVVAYTYIAFGTLDFSDYITTNKRSVALLFTYTAVLYLLFFFPV
jgi:hypothetical protein